MKKTNYLYLRNYTQNNYSIRYISEKVSNTIGKS